MINLSQTDFIIFGYLVLGLVIAWATFKWVQKGFYFGDGEEVLAGAFFVLCVGLWPVVVLVAFFEILGNFLMKE